MGIKKIARPINKAKNAFIKWLKDKNAEDIEVFEGEGSEEWDYYRSVSAFIGEWLYIVNFQMWHGKIKIKYSDDENIHDNMTIDEFIQLIKN